MVGFTTEVSIQNSRLFTKNLDNLIKQGGDTSIAFELIKDDFLRSNKSQFNLRGDGQYAPLSKAWKERKKSILGKDVPILNFRGRLKKSLTEESSNDFIFKRCLLYTSPSPRDLSTSRMPSSA